MKLEDKKFLAEWMGWKVHRRYGLDDVLWFELDFGDKSISITKWNPDTDHQQFAEVWNKMQTWKQDMVNERILPIYSPSHFVTEVLNSLPKVMEAVLEVLKGGG